MEVDWTSAAVAAGILVLVLPAMLIFRRFSRRTGSIRFSSTTAFTRMRPTLRQRLRWLVPTLRVLAIVLLLVGLARPRKGEEFTDITTQGIAIQMVVDRSSSMWDNAMRFEGQSIPRLEVVKRIFKQFVLGDGDELDGRGDDMIGLTTFARFAEEECPVTLDHGNLVGFIDSLTHATTEVENGTNISDALYQAVLSLVVADDYVRESIGREDEYRIVSKVIILLTDGEQSPRIAQHSFTEVAEFAQENEIKIHSVAITGGRDSRRGFFTLLEDRIDTSHIKKVAESTGGAYHEASDGDSLREIYANIDSMERSDFKEVFRRYHELYEWPVLAAFACVLLEVLLGCTLFRRIP